METNSINLLLKAHNNSTRLYKNRNFDDKIYHSIGCYKNKKWIGNILPQELLAQDIKESIELIVSLSESEIFYSDFPKNIETPNYGDNWGRFANY